MTPLPEAAVVLERRGAVGWITLNRPAARNALSRPVREGILEGLRQWEGDPEIAVLVLTGAGERAFCSGGDLKEMAAEGLRVPPPDYVPQPGRTIQITKPVIAAVNGLAYAGGFLLAQSCDLCVAAEHATFAVSEARWGRGAPWAAPLPWLIPPRAAMQLLLTARPVSAATAHAWGLVNEVVPGAELQEHVQALAEVIAGNAPLSVRAGKAMVYATAEYPRTEAFDIAERIFEPAYLSEDAQEGPRAFQERRKPDWRGR